MKTPRIGWAGLGNMGTAMATNLLKSGYELKVFNRNRDKEKSLTDLGATSAKNLVELVDTCEIVFTMLSDDIAVKEVYSEEDGLLSGNKQGTLLIDMSTVSPDTSKHLFALCQKHQVNFIDAPVSGSVKPAQDRALIILAGGRTEDFEMAKPLFDKLGKLSLHLGMAGAGSSAKIAINYLLGVNIQALAETVLFAQKNGIRKEDMLTIINEGACGNGMTKLKTPSIIAEHYPAAFALKYIVKDLKLAKDAGLASPLAAPLLNTFNAAMNDGFGDQDLMAVIKYLEKT